MTATSDIAPPNFLGGTGTTLSLLAVRRHSGAQRPVAPTVTSRRSARAQEREKEPPPDEGASVAPPPRPEARLVAPPSSEPAHNALALTVMAPHPSGGPWRSLGDAQIDAEDSPGARGR